MFLDYCKCSLLLQTISSNNLEEEQKFDDDWNVSNCNDSMIAPDHSELHLKNLCAYNGEMIIDDKLDTSIVVASNNYCSYWELHNVDSTSLMIRMLYAIVTKLQGWGPNLRSKVG